jgi:hypothetical protein
MWDMFWFFMIPLKLIVACWIAYKVTTYFLGFL